MTFTLLQLLSLCGYLRDDGNSIPCLSVLALVIFYLGISLGVCMGVCTIATFVSKIRN